MRRTLTAIILIILSITAGAQEQDKPGYKLSDQERQRLVLADQALGARKQELNHAVNEMAATPLECEKTLAAVAKFQKARLAFQAAQSQWDNALELIKAKHDCEDCELSKEGSTLVKPSNKKRQ